MSQRNIPEISFEVYDVVTLLNVGMSRSLVRNIQQFHIYKW